MSTPQPGILDEVPAFGSYLTFDLRPGTSIEKVRESLAIARDLPRAVLGIGPGLCAFLGQPIPGLRPLAPFFGAGFSVPSTPASFWVWLRAEHEADLAGPLRTACEGLDEAFYLSDHSDGFRFKEGRDLTGYVDGTENPEGPEAEAAALVSGCGPGFDGGSFVAVQRWVHNFETFQALSEAETDAIIGRRLRDNEEMEDAPESAHVKRTAQEDYDPEAFLLRRSMPWRDVRGSGLMFVAFGKSLQAFEQQMARMSGVEDDVVDALFRFSRPVTGASFFCPPRLPNGDLDLRGLGGS